MIKKNCEGSKTGSLMIKLFVEKLQNGLSLLAPRESQFDQESDRVPDDVKEGNFAVFAVKGDEIQRFVAELCYLEDPEFLRLLEQAAEEYGFKQKGALTIPCKPQELLKIPLHQCYNNISAGAGNFVRWNPSIIRSY